MNGLRNSNFQDNEIVKASDVQLLGDGSIENLGKAIKTLFGTSKSVVIGGKITAKGSGLVAKMNPIMGVHADSEDLFLDHEGKFYYDEEKEPSENITFDRAGTSARRDLVEVKADVITTVEQSRQFYDPETESSAYSQTDVEKRQILRIKVKKGTNGSDTAPAVDTGYVKLAEVIIQANATTLTNADILNVTADIEGIDNTGWSTDKQVTINPGTIKDISTKFREIHNSDGSLKNSIIAQAKIILSGEGALKGDAIQKGGEAETIDGTSVAATTSISDFIKKIVARINKTWEVSTGGTGATTAKAAQYNLLNNMNSDTTDPTDDSNFVMMYASGSTTNGAVFKISGSYVWNWIKGKISSVLGLTSENYGGKAATSGAADSASQASKLSTARKLKVALGSTTDVTFDGSGDQTSIPVNGTLGAGNGGTGQTTLKNSANALINALETGSSDPVDNDYFVSQYANGGTTTTTFHRRPVSALWNYIKGKISSDLGLTKTSYGGSCGKADKLNTARKLKVALGSTTDVTFDGSGDQTSIPVNGTLAIGNGGTGATTVAGARNNLGLGNTNGALPIANGGTGQTTAAAARNALGLGNTTGAVPVANGGTGATTAANARTNLGLGNVTNEAYPLPIGFIYTQYPGEKTPAELGLSGTWKDITSHFAGLFFRAEGENAKTFTTCSYEISARTATTINVKGTLTGISVGDVVFCYTTANYDTPGKKRVVSAISSNTITFTDSDSTVYTNVLITQRQGIPNISGNIYGFDSTWQSGGYTDGVFKNSPQALNGYILQTQYASGVTVAKISFDASKSNSIYGANNNVTPANTSIILWKRTA